MKNDQFPEETAASESTPGPHIPDPEPNRLWTVPELQRYVDASLARYHAARGRAEEEPAEVYRPQTVARIGPTLPIDPESGLPISHYPYVQLNTPEEGRAVDLAPLHLANPTAANFSSAAASAAGCTALEHIMLFAGRDASHTTAYATAPADAAAHSSAQVDDAANSCLYCVASTSQARDYNSPTGADSDTDTSATDSATSPETVAANEINAASGTIRRRMFDDDDDDDEDMAEQAQLRKVAKRSEQHMSANAGDRRDGDDDDMMMDCTTSE